MLTRLEDNFNDKQTTTMARIGAEYTHSVHIWFLTRRRFKHTRAHILQIVYKAVLLQIIIIAAGTLQSNCSAPSITTTATGEKRM